MIDFHWNLWKKERWKKPFQYFLQKKKRVPGSLKMKELFLRNPIEKIIENLFFCFVHILTVSVALNWLRIHKTKPKTYSLRPKIARKGLNLGLFSSPNGPKAYFCPPLKCSGWTIYIWWDIIHNFLQLISVDTRWYQLIPGDTRWYQVHLFYQNWLRLTKNCIGFGPLHLAHCSK